MASGYGANWIGLLPEAVQVKLRTVMVRRHFDPGRAIYHSGDDGATQFQIVEGAVRIRSLSASGREAIYVIYGPGDCIGYISAIDGGPRPQDAIAVGQTTVDCLNKEDFDRLRAQHPEINEALLIHLARRARELYRVYMEGNFSSLRQRLASQLEFMLAYHAKDQAGEEPITLALTHEMLAASVCATRQAISKLLQEWVVEGVIDHHYGSLRVLDRERLADIARND